MTKLEDLKFTEREAQRIIADAAEREARDEGLDDKTIGYNELVKRAQEALIDPKYLKVSAKDLIKEAGGLEKAAIKNSFKTVGNVFYNIASLYFALPYAARKHGVKGRSEDNFVSWMGGTINAGILIGEAAWGFDHDSDLGLIFFGTHLATNIASGIYELYRHEKNKLVEEMNGEDKK